MNTIHSLTARFATITILMATFLAPAAIAQDDPSTPTPAEISQRCIHQIRQTTERTNEDVRGIAAITRQLIREIDDAGAEDARIFAAGRHGSQHATDRAHTGMRHINTLADNCVRVLNEIEAPRRFIIAVVGAKRYALSSINNTLFRAKTSIARTIYIATNN